MQNHGERTPMANICNFFMQNIVFDSPSKSSWLHLKWNPAYFAGPPFLWHFAVLQRKKRPPRIIHNFGGHPQSWVRRVFVSPLRMVMGPTVAGLSTLRQTPLFPALVLSLAIVSVVQARPGLFVSVFVEKREDKCLCKVFISQG